MSNDDIFEIAFYLQELTPEERIISQLTDD